MITCADRLEALAVPGLPLVGRGDDVPALVIARYFAAEQEAIEKLEAEVAAIAQALEEMAEEHSGEEGLLEAAKNDKDKLTRASVAARLKAIKADLDEADGADECAALEQYRSEEHTSEL